MNALNWANEGVFPDDVVKAIEEREATAQTIVDKGLSLPHAMIDWTGDFRIVLGRSLAGVDNVATGDKLYLIVLLVVGKGRERTHLNVLAAVAELLGDDEFRRTLVTADHVRDIKSLLVERADRQSQRWAAASGDAEAEHRRRQARGGAGGVRVIPVRVTTVHRVRWPSRIVIAGAVDPSWQQRSNRRRKLPTRMIKDSYSASETTASSNLSMHGNEPLERAIVIGVSLTPTPFVQFHHGKNRECQQKQDPPVIQSDRLGAQQHLSKRCVHGSQVNAESGDRSGQQDGTAQRRHHQRRFGFGAAIADVNVLKQHHQ